MPAHQTLALAALLSMAALGLALPQAEVSQAVSSAEGPTGTEGVISPTLGTAIGGALDSVHAGATPAPEARALGKRLDTPPEYLTITIVNQYGAAISTSHAANGATAAFAVPTGWGGNVAIVPASHAITGDDSLIEASFVVDPGYTVAAIDIDVSYVNGFSVPIICECRGHVLVGCNKNLFALNSCPNNDGQRACDNPLRASNSATSPTAFFAPCKGAAYTFPNDSGANLWGNSHCQEGHIICCVGTSCPPSVLQH